MGYIVSGVLVFGLLVFVYNLRDSLTFHNRKKERDVMYIITWQLKSDTVIRHYHYEIYKQAIRQLKALRSYDDVKYALMKWKD